MLKLHIIIILLLTYSINNQLNDNQAINSCGSLSNYQQPNDINDCKPGGSDFECCFVDIPEKKMKYCSYLSGKINDDIIKQFKTTLGLGDIVIECNNAVHLVLHSLMMIVLCLIA